MHPWDCACSSSRCARLYHGRRAPRGTQTHCDRSIADNIREDAAQTIRWFKENDVAIASSGRHPRTVSEVAKRVGVANAENIFLSKV